MGVGLAGAACSRPSEQEEEEGDMTCPCSDPSNTADTFEASLTSHLHLGCSGSPCFPGPLLLRMLANIWDAEEASYLLHWCYRDRGEEGGNAEWFFIKLQFQGLCHVDSPSSLNLLEDSTVPSEGLPAGGAREHPTLGKALGSPCTTLLSLPPSHPQTI